LHWKKAWWNPNFHKRANLALLPTELRLANDPWFVLCREDVQKIIWFVKNKIDLVNIISKGGLANESLFAIIFYLCNKLTSIINKSTHITDWSKMETSTSPYVFKNGNLEEIQTIENLLNTSNSNYTIFIRKIAREFPDEVLKKYIYPLNEKTKLDYNIKKNKIKKNIFLFLFFSFFLFYHFFLFYNLFSFLKS
jgi:hypothetical protein